MGKVLSENAYKHICRHVKKESGHEGLGFNLMSLLTASTVKNYIVTVSRDFVLPG